MRPHQFGQFITRERPPLFFAGAGLSWGIVPGPRQLLSEYKSVVEERLGVTFEVDAAKASAFYEWAQGLLDQLPSTGTEPPKLRLAKALGILDDAHWAATVTFPAATLPARHRVIARFAREELWQGVWTWNWDCLLESALESIGVRRGQPEREQPWLTRFAAVVLSDDFQLLSNRHVLCILKPHGCAHRMVEAAARFADGEIAEAEEIASRLMIGVRELTETRDTPTDGLFFDKMRYELASYPAVIVGWSVSEPYLQAVINNALSRVSKGQLEELSIVDVLFNDAGHPAVCDCYGLAQNQVFFEVSGSEPGFTTDAFFLWLQSLLTVTRMREAAPDRSESIEHAAATLADHATLSVWCDVFMPAWTRLCWRANVIVCPGFEPYQLDLDQAEEYIPLTLPNVVRSDLEAASHLFVCYGVFRDWDLQTFPGAFWDQSSLRLVLPLPAWGELNDLNALKWLNTETALGLVEKLDIVPLHFDRSVPLSSGELTEMLKEKVSRVISHPTFCDPNEIGVADDVLGALNGG